MTEADVWTRRSAVPVLSSWLGQRFPSGQERGKVAEEGALAGIAVATLQSLHTYYTAIKRHSLDHDTHITDASNLFVHFHHLRPSCHLLIIPRSEAHLLYPLRTYLYTPPKSSSTPPHISHALPQDTPHRPCPPYHLAVQP